MNRMSGRQVAILEAVRTPVGRGHVTKGVFRSVLPSNLLAAVYKAVIERADISPDLVDDVASGCCEQWGEQGLNIARNAWLEAGLPIETPAATIDRQCGSSQQAVNYGAAMIAAGVVDTFVGAGVEHMGRNSVKKVDEIVATYGDPISPALRNRFDLVHQGESAELIADKWNLSRTELDEYAVRSNANAARATEEGRFEREIVPIDAEGQSVTQDQGIRPGTSLETLAALKPAFRPDGRLTAGNSSQMSDGAAAVLLMERAKAEALGLQVRAIIEDQVTVGVDPILMLTGPIPATSKILERNNLVLDDIDLIEVNEAFASVIGAWEREHNPDMDRVNVNGGSIAIGHAMGGTGARLIATLLHELERTDKELGLVTMCVGGGIGTGTLIRRV